MSRVIIGVDTGVDCRYVIGNRDGLFKYGQFGLDAEKKLTELLQYWEKAILIIDQGGDILMARKLRQRFPGRVFLCHYQADHKTLKLVRWGDNDEYGNVLVDRNRMIQLVVDEFSDGRTKLHYVQSKDEWYDYWLHFSHIYRVSEEDGRTKRLVYRWERSDRDDWVHATVYCKVGLMRFGGKGSIVRAFPPTEATSYSVTKEGKTDGLPPTIKTMVEEVDRRNKPGYISGVDENDDWRE